MRKHPTPNNLTELKKHLKHKMCFPLFMKSHMLELIERLEYLEAIVKEELE